MKLLKFKPLWLVLVGGSLFALGFHGGREFEKMENDAWELAEMTVMLKARQDGRWSGEGTIRAMPYEMRAVREQLRDREWWVRLVPLRGTEMIRIWDENLSVGEAVIKSQDETNNRSAE